MLIRKRPQVIGGGGGGHPLHPPPGSAPVGMSQSCFMGDKIGHAKSVGFRLYSAIRRSESRFSLRCREINSISLLFEEETIIFVA